MDSRVCLTTFVYGDKYQDYIPLLMYSIGRAYPEYFTIIFLHGKLREDIREQLEIIKEFYTNFEIVENKFADCPQMNPLKSMCLRWVLWDDKFNDFDYLYVVDIDILYLPESLPLHEQHIQHMKYIGSDCVSNIVRKGIPKKNLINIFRIVKGGGIISAYKYLTTDYELRCTGLHFVAINKYFNYITNEVRSNAQRMIYRNEIYKKSVLINDEAFLFRMLKDVGIDTSLFPIQSNSVTMLDFNNPCRKEFRPHHGIHLGIFRSEIGKMTQSTIEILESPSYKYYYDLYESKIKNDPYFIRISSYFSENVIQYFHKLNAYYSK